MTTKQSIGSSISSPFLSHLLSLSAMQKTTSRKNRKHFDAIHFSTSWSPATFSPRIRSYAYWGDVCYITCNNNSLATNNLVSEKCHPKSITHPMGAPAQIFFIKKRVTKLSLHLVKSLGRVLTEPELHLTLPPMWALILVAPSPPRTLPTNVKEPLKFL
jgi:hypothetical protein